VDFSEFGPRHLLDELAKFLFVLSTNARTLAELHVIRSVLIEAGEKIAELVGGGERHRSSPRSPQDGGHSAGGGELRYGIMRRHGRWEDRTNEAIHEKRNLVAALEAMLRLAIEQRNGNLGD
jgi:hypothetical protein